VGGILAQNGINIAALALGRSAPGGEALTVISLDEPISADALESIEALEGVEGVRSAQL